MKLALLLIALALIDSPAAHARKKKQKTLTDLMVQKVEEKMTAPPVDEEVCFAPDEPCDTKLVKFIDSAQASLDVAIFDVNLDQVVHHILLQARKIPVRVLVDQRQSKGDHSLVRTLIKGGATVRTGRQRGIMHNKFTIVDGKMIVTGSFNYTNGAAEKNSENQVYLAKPAIVDRYKKRFEKLWSESKPSKLTP